MMTKEEVMEALDKSGVDYEFIAEHFDCMRIKVNFEPEEEDNEEYTTPKFDPQPITYECSACGYDELPEDIDPCPKCNK